MADVSPMPVPIAPSGTMPPPGPPQPWQPVQIMLPPPLQEVMQKFPEIERRVGALEAKPAGGHGAALVAAFLAGAGLLALAVFLWHYGAVLVRG